MLADNLTINLIIMKNYKKINLNRTNSIRNLQFESPFSPSSAPIAIHRFSISRKKKVNWLKKWKQNGTIQSRIPGGGGELSERQQKLGQHLSQLVRIAEEFNIAVVVINQCMADPAALSIFGPVVKPVGGHVLAHASTTRIMLKKGKGEQRIAKIFDRCD
jgi:hypothetical protein